MMRDVMVSDGLTHAEATERFYALGSRGLLVDDSPRLRDFQVPYARPATQVAQWPGAERGNVTLADVVQQVQPTMLIGTSTQAERSPRRSCGRWRRTPNESSARVLQIRESRSSSCIVPQNDSTRELS